MNKRTAYVDELPRTYPDKPINNHGRHISHLRLAVTDKCSLCCQYCISAEGIPLDGLMQLRPITGEAEH